LRTEFISGGNPAKTGAFRCETVGVRASCAANRRDRRRIGLGAAAAGGRPVAGRRSMAKVFFPDRERLAAKGYRWSDGSDGRPRSWYIDIDESKLDDEIAFLKTEIYLGDVEPPFQILTAFNRFSVRV